MKNKKFKVEVKQDWCKSCEICVEICPKNVFEMDNFYSTPKKAEDCIGCLQCEKLCPDFAITVTPLKDEAKE
ncbi:MAG: ferredoxin family protein [Fidelibacterota bacterium]